MEVIMKVDNGNAVSSVISEKMCGQTNTQTNKQTTRPKPRYSHRQCLHVQSKIVPIANTSDSLHIRATYTSSPV